jgi:hypothetical protein
LPSLFLLTTACGFDPDAGEDRLWASRQQIIEAAERCGVPNFEPTKANAHWAAYVEGEDPSKGPKGDCIYADLQKQGLKATR